MNKEARIAAEELLRDYRLQLSRARKNGRWSDERRAAMQAANQMLPKVNAILLALVPDTEPVSAVSCGSTGQREVGCCAPKTSSVTGTR